MKTNSAATPLRKNHSSGHQPELAPSQIEIGHGARQPPKNSVVASAETVIMLMYSARKNSANFSDEYSVWNPPTSSDSASGRSNGARLVSPTMAMTNTAKLGISSQPNQPDDCAPTMSAVDSDPADRITPTTERPNAIS